MWLRRGPFKSTAAEQTLRTRPCSCRRCLRATGQSLRGAFGGRHARTTFAAQFTRGAEAGPSHGFRSDFADAFEANATSASQYSSFAGAVACTLSSPGSQRTSAVPGAFALHVASGSHRTVLPRSAASGRNVDDSKNRLPLLRRRVVRGKPGFRYCSRSTSASSITAFSPRSVAMRCRREDFGLISPARATKAWKLWLPHHLAPILGFRLREVLGVGRQHRRAQ